MALVVLLILGVIVWKLWSPGLAFVPSFAALLERPAGSSGLWPFIRGVETVGGQYQKRTVLLVLHHKRGRHSLGYLVVSLQPRGNFDHLVNDASAFRAAMQTTAARDAWDRLELRQDLALSFGEGGVRAMWRPSGLLIFPGRFEQDRWRKVLDSMHTIVTSLEETRAPTA